MERLATIHSSLADSKCSPASSTSSSSSSSSSSSNNSASYYHKQQFEHYVFILDEVMNKWRMLEMFTIDERVLNEKLNQIVLDLAPLKTQIVQIGKACRLDSNLLEMNFNENLSELLKRFEVFSLQN